MKNEVAIKLKSTLELINHYCDKLQYQIIKLQDSDVGQEYTDKYNKLNYQYGTRAYDSVHQIKEMVALLKVHHFNESPDEYKRLRDNR